jgi:hypothetical protein
VDEASTQNDDEEIVIPKNPVVLVGGKAKEPACIKALNGLGAKCTEDLDQ